MIAYLDASALAKVFLDEDGLEIAREVWESELPVLTARVAQVELACALSSAARDRRIEVERIVPELLDGTVLWGRAEAVELDADVLTDASRLGLRHGLATLDAIHVAAALSVTSAHPTLVSWDHAQRLAAVSEGLPVYP